MRDHALSKPFLTMLVAAATIASWGSRGVSIERPPSLLVGGLLGVAEVRDERTEMGIEERDDAQHKVKPRTRFDG